MLPLTRTLASNALKSPTAEFCKIKLRTTSGTLTLRYRKQPMLDAERFHAGQNAQDEGSTSPTPDSAVIPKSEPHASLDIDDHTFEKLTDLSECSEYCCDVSAGTYGILNATLEHDFSGYHFWASEDSCASASNNTVTGSNDELASIPDCSDLLETALTRQQSCDFCMEHNLEDICSVVSTDVYANPIPTPIESDIARELAFSSSFHIEKEFHDFPSRYVKISPEDQAQIDSSELELIHFPAELQLEASSTILPYPCSKGRKIDNDKADSLESETVRESDHSFPVFPELPNRGGITESNMRIEDNTKLQTDPGKAEGMSLTSINKKKRKSRARRTFALQTLKFSSLLGNEYHEKEERENDVRLEYEDGGVRSSKSPKVECQVYGNLFVKNTEEQFVFASETENWNRVMTSQGYCDYEKEGARPTKRPRQPRKPAKRLAHIYATGQEGKEDIDRTMRPSRWIAINSSTLVRGLRPQKRGRKPTYAGRNSLNRKGCLPEEAVSILRQWLNIHLDYPFATKQEKENLASITGLEMSQVENWLSNARYKLRMRGGESSEKFAFPLRKQIRKRTRKPYCYIHAGSCFCTT